MAPFNKPVRNGSRGIDTHLDNTIKVGNIEVVSPGVAFEWKQDSTGLKIFTNLTVEDVNRRDPKLGLIVFKSEAAAWGWARRVANRDYT